MHLYTRGAAVRVVALHGPPAEHLALGLDVRPPQVGDLGVVVGFEPASARPSPATRYVVEGGERGALEWLAVFHAAELEPTTPPL